MKSPLHTRLFVTVTAATSAFGLVAHADTVVQIPVDSVMDGRSVSTLTGGIIVPWTVGQGVYGDGYADAYVTKAVEAKLPPMPPGLALPDDGVFPATARLPQIVLHFSNTASATSPQTHQVHINTGPQTFQFPVPPATYSKLFLLLTASEGTGKFSVTLSYAGGVPSTTTAYMLPDSGGGGTTNPNDPVYFNLIQGMRKWSPTDVEGDTTTHGIGGIEIVPSPTATLTGVQVTKTAAHLVFWGATGIATSPVDAGTPITTDAGTTGGADASTGDDGGGDAQATTGGTTATTSTAGTTATTTTSTAGTTGTATGTTTGGNNGAVGTTSATNTTTTGTNAGTNGTATGGTTGVTTAGTNGASGTAGTTGTGNASGNGASGTASNGTSTTSGANYNSNSSGCSVTAGAGGTLSLWSSLLVLWGARRKRRARV
jgi:hypothetical protein